MNKPASNTIKRQLGYTLTEVLVALTIMAILSTFLFSALQWGSRAWSVAERTEENARVDATYALIRRTLEAAVLKFEIGADGERTPTFIGESDTIRFTGPAPAQVDTPGLYRLQISIERGAEGRNLYLKRTLYRDRRERNEENPLNDAKPFLLIPSVDEIRLSYFGALEEEDTPEWRDNWLDANRLPERIRIDLIFPDGDKRNWPSLIVTPRITR